MSGKVLNREINPLQGGKTMKIRFGLCALSLFALPLTAFSANLSAQKTTQKPAEPMGVTAQPNTVITPPIGPKVAHDVNFIFTADFIYWKAMADGFEYAASGVAIVGTDTLTPVPSPKQGKVKGPDFDFQPGFKVGAGLKFAHDGWDLYANYTWLNPTTVESSLSDPSGHMVGNGDPYFGAATLSKASNHFKQNFNVIDLELGRNFFLSKYMTLRPFFGLKTAWINQHVQNSYTVFNDATNGINASDGLLPSGQINFLHQKLKIESWGIGVRGGISPVWYFMKDFGIYGNFALSGMWTNYEDHIETTYSGTISGTSQHAVRSSHTVTPVIELGLGLTYVTTFDDDTYGFSLSAGWEEQMWVGFNEGAPRGNMALQGFTLKVGFEL